MLANWLVRRTGPHTSELARTTVGDLGQLPSVGLPTKLVQSVCGYCATGCALTIHMKGAAAVRISPSKSYPVNTGSACPKGWEALAPIKAKNRLMTPLLRDANGQLKPVSWDRAKKEFVARFKQIKATHGGAANAWLSTGQIPTEEMAILGAFAKFEMGMVHGDGNTRQCMATAAAAHKESFGFDAPPFTYGDFEASDVIVLVGSNLCIAHPILWDRILRNPHNPHVVVIDPRVTETASAATSHLQIKARSDLALFCGLANLLIAANAVDEEFIRAHTNGFEDWTACASEWTIEKTSESTGLSEDDLRGFAELIAEGQRVSFWWTMGVNQGHQAVRTAQAIINVALMTGNIGRPGTGANSITGQCNAMGSRILANTTNLFGGRDFAKAEHREEVASLLGIDEAKIPRAPSWSYDQIMDGIDSEEIRGLWIVATNTAHSWIDSKRAVERLKKLDFLVVQDLFGDTQTALLADLVLPAAGWGEKEGTFINAERRIGITAKVVEPVGESLSDFEIVRQLAMEWGENDWIQRWSTPREVFAILQRLSVGRPCDFSGIEGYEHLEAAGGMQWPFTNEDRPLSDPVAEEDHPVFGKGMRGKPNERRLFEDGTFFHPDGKARFISAQVDYPSEVRSCEYPFLLITGRDNSAVWHTGTRTGTSSVLRMLMNSEVSLSMHRGDAVRTGIADGVSVKVSSPSGSFVGVVRHTDSLQEGHLFVSMHHVETNRVVAAAFDPISRQPAYKQSYVQIALL